MIFEMFLETTKLEEEVGRRPQFLTSRAMKKDLEAWNLNLIYTY